MKKNVSIAENPKEWARVRAMERNLFRQRFQLDTQQALDLVWSRWPERNTSELWADAFLITAEDTATADAFNLLELEVDNPIHWRAMVEMFTRTLLAPRGRPKKATTEWHINLALDLRSVWPELPQNDRAHSAAAQLLIKRFKDRYGEMKSDSLRKSIKNTIDAVGKIDDGLIIRLHKAYGETFWDIFLARNGDNLSAWS